MHRRHFVALLALIVIALTLISCGSSNPNIGRILLSVSVTPTAADAQNFTNQQVVFTATGTFSLPPYTGPLTFTAPYAGQFVVDNPTNPVASVVSTGDGSVTTQCTSGASGTVAVTASASANNGTNTVISGSGQLTCP